MVRKLNSAVRGCIGKTMVDLCGGLVAARGRRFFVEIGCRWSSVGAEGEEKKRKAAERGC
jgi:hypothetical protein